MSFTTVTHLPLLSDIRRRLLDRTVVANMAEILEHHQVELLIEGGSATATFRHRCSPRTARIAVAADCSSGRGHWKLVSAVAPHKAQLRRFYSYETVWPAPCGAGPALQGVARLVPATQTASVLRRVVLGPTRRRSLKVATTHTRLYKPTGSQLKRPLPQLSHLSLWYTILEAL